MTMIHHPVPIEPARPGRFIAQAMAACRGRRVRAATPHALSGISDHTLRDIGMNRPQASLFEALGDLGPIR